MSKKFTCPACGQHRIQFVEKGFTRVSNVVEVLTEEAVEKSFLYNLESFKPQLRIESHYQCPHCDFELGSSIALIRAKYFKEEKAKITTSTYKVKEITHCSGDSPTTREHTDLINLIIRTAGGKIKVINDSSPECIKTQKLIRERPYLFDRRR